MSGLLRVTEILGEHVNSELFFDRFNAKVRSLSVFCIGLLGLIAKYCWSKISKYHLDILCYCAYMVNIYFQTFDNDYTLLQGLYILFCICMSSLELNVDLASVCALICIRFFEPIFVDAFCYGLLLRAMTKLGLHGIEDRIVGMIWLLIPAVFYEDSKLFHMAVGFAVAMSHDVVSMREVLFLSSTQFILAPLVNYYIDPMMQVAMFSVLLQREMSRQQSDAFAVLEEEQLKWFHCLLVTPGEFMRLVKTANWRVFLPIFMHLSHSNKSLQFRIITHLSWNFCSGVTGHFPRGMMSSRDTRRNRKKIDSFMSGGDVPKIQQPKLKVKKFCDDKVVREKHSATDDELILSKTVLPSLPKKKRFTKMDLRKQRKVITKKGLDAEFGEFSVIVGDIVLQGREEDKPTIHFTSSQLYGVRQDRCDLLANMYGWSHEQQKLFWNQAQEWDWSCATMDEMAAQFGSYDEEVSFDGNLTTIDEGDIPDEDSIITGADLTHDITDVEHFEEIVQRELLGSAEPMFEPSVIDSIMETLRRIAHESDAGSVNSSVLTESDYANHVSYIVSYFIQLVNAFNDGRVTSMIAATNLYLGAIGIPTTELVMIKLSSWLLQLITYFSAEIPERQSLQGDFAALFSTVTAIFSDLFKRSNLDIPLDKAPIFVKFRNLILGFLSAPFLVAASVFPSMKEFDTWYEHASPMFSGLHVLSGLVAFMIEFIKTGIPFLSGKFSADELFAKPEYLKWAEEAQAAIDLSAGLVSKASDLISAEQSVMKLVKLKSQYARIVASSVTLQNDRVCHMVIKSTYDALTEAIRKNQAALFGSLPSVQPYAFCLMSMPGCFKSLVTTIMYTELWEDLCGLDKIPFDPSLVATYTAAAARQDNITSMTRVIIVDEGSGPGFIKVMPNILQCTPLNMVNAVPMMLDKAHLDDKGTSYMRPYMVVFNANSPDLNMWGVVKHVSAAFRRIQTFVTIKRVSGNVASKGFLTTAEMLVDLRFVIEHPMFTYNNGLLLMFLRNVKDNTTRVYGPQTGLPEDSAAAYTFDELMEYMHAHVSFYMAKEMQVRGLRTDIITKGLCPTCKKSLSRCLCAPHVPKPVVQGIESVAEAFVVGVFITFIVMLMQFLSLLAMKNWFESFVVKLISGHAVKDSAKLTMTKAASEAISDPEIIARGKTLVATAAAAALQQPEIQVALDDAIKAYCAKKIEAVAIFYRHAMPALEKVLYVAAGAGTAYLIFSKLSFIIPQGASRLTGDDEESISKLNVAFGTVPRAPNHPTSNPYLVDAVIDYVKKKPVSQVEKFLQIVKENSIFYTVRIPGTQPCIPGCGIIIKGKMMMTTAHQVRTYKHVPVVSFSIHTTGIANLSLDNVIPVRLDEIIFHPEQDVCLIPLGARPSKQKLTHIFCEKYGRHYLGPALLCRLDRDGKYEVFSTTIRDLVQVPHEGRMLLCYSYTAPCPDEVDRNGDCGSVLISIVNGGFDIVGFHIAVSKEDLATAFALPMTKREVDALLEGLPVTVQGLEVPDSKKLFDLDLERDDLHEKAFLKHVVKGYGELVGVNNELRRKLPRNTLVTTPIAAYFSPLSFAPAVTTYQVVGDEWRSPLAMNLLQRTQRPVHMDPMLRAEAFIDYNNDVLTLFKDQWCDVTPYTLDQALNGIPGIMKSMNFSTAAGAGLGGTKKSWIYLESGRQKPGKELLTMINVALDNLEKGVTNNFVVNMTPKVELRGLLVDGSVKDARIFAAAHFVMCIVMRMFYGPYFDVIFSGIGYTEHAVGINCFDARQWSKEASKHIKMGPETIAQDRERYDTKNLLPYFVMLNAATFISEHCSYNDRAKRILFSLVEEMPNTICCFSGLLVIVKCTLFSGVPYTTQMNCICESVYTRTSYYYAYRVLNNSMTWVDVRNKAPKFREVVAVSNFGDDNLNTPAPSIRSFFKAEVIQDFFNMIDLPTSDAKKTGKLRFDSFADIDFLKRSFVLDVASGLFKAPLEEKSIIKSLCYRDSSSPLPSREHLKVVLEGAALEFFMHGKDKYEDFIAKRRVWLDNLGPEYIGIEISDVPYTWLYERFLVFGLPIPITIQGIEWDPPGERRGCAHVVHPTCDAFEGDCITCGSDTEMFQETKSGLDLVVYFGLFGPNSFRGVRLPGVKIISGTDSNLVNTMVESPAVGSVAQQNLQFTGGEETVDTGDLLPAPSKMPDLGEIATYLSRPVKMPVFNTATAGLVYNPWVSFLTDTGVAHKIAGFARLRGTLCLRFVVCTSQFYRGRMYISYSAGRTDLGSRTAVTVLPHVVIDGGEAVDKVMRIPFHFPDDYINLDLGVSTYFTTNVARLIPFMCYGTTNVSTGTVTGYDIQTFAWMEDVELKILTLTSQGKEEKASSKIKTVSTAFGMMSDLPIIGPFAKAASGAASIASSVASLFGFSRPIIETISLMRTRFANNLALVETNEAIMKMTMMKDTQRSIGGRGVTGNDLDEMAFAHVASKLAYIAEVYWDSSQVPETSLLTLPVNPLYVPVTAGTTIDLTPLAHVCAPFKYWRGCISYTFSVVKAPLFKGKLRITWSTTSPIVAIPYNAAYSVIWDVTDQKDITITVPWANNDPWLPTSWPGIGDPIQNGFVNISVLETLTGIADDNVAFIEVFIAGGKDLEVSVPYYGNIASLVPIVPTTTTGPVYSTKVVSWLQPGGTTSPFANVIPQGEESEVFMFDCVEDATAVKSCVGEKVESFRALGKRYCLGITIHKDANLLFIPNIPLFPGGFDEGAGVKKTIDFRWTYHTWAMLGYAFTSGSSRIKVFAYPGTLHGESISESFLMTAVFDTASPFSAPVVDYGFSTYNNQICFGGAAQGMQIFNMGAEACEIEIPNPVWRRYSDVFSISPTNSVVAPANQNGVLLFVSPARTAAATTYVNGAVLYAASDDFSCYLYQGCPKLHFYATIPA